MKNVLIFLIVLIFVSCSVKPALYRGVSLDEEQYKSDYIVSYILNDILQPREPDLVFESMLLDTTLRFDQDVIGISTLKKEKVREKLSFFEKNLAKKFKYHRRLLDKSSKRFSIQVLHQELLEEEKRMDREFLMDRVSYKAVAYFSDIYKYLDRYYVYVNVIQRQIGDGFTYYNAYGALYEYAICPSSGAIVFKNKKERGDGFFIKIINKEFKHWGCSEFYD